MLRRANRLRSPRDFRNVYEVGKSITSPSFIIRARSRGSHQTLRVGIVVGTKLSKKATVRNRLRRRVREAVRQCFVPALRDLDLVVIPRAAARTRTFGELVSECESLVRRINTSRR